MSENVFKMIIRAGDMEHPIPCTSCSADAAVLFFEKFATRLPAAAVALRKKSAKCWGCLSMEEMRAPSVDTA